MNLILAIPLQVRLAALCALGAVLGGVLNWAIYTLAWRKRAISPWSPSPPHAPPRRWSDRLPVVGWFGLRREWAQHGPRFWVRPLLVELIAGAGLPALYWWEVARQGLYIYPPGVVDVPLAILHLQFASHAVLLALMLVATFIDIDEKTIPDGVTLTGTVAGLLLAAAAPAALLPTITFAAVPPPLGVPVPALLQLRIRHGGPGIGAWQEFVTLAAPAEWPEALGGAPRLLPLLLGLLCYWLWCFAFAPRPWHIRHGLKRAVQVAAARLFRSLRHPLLLGMILVGTLFVAGVWWTGGRHWAGLLTSLVGLAFAGGLVWAVRIIGAVTLKKEAMGFGDVLLMMMIGTFVGWQAALLIFFLAPLAGLVIGLVNLVVNRDQEIPYGPFLCLASGVVVLGWAPIWHAQRTQHVFQLGWWLPAILACGLVLMGLMLFCYQRLKEWLLG